MNENIILDKISKVVKNAKKAKFVKIVKWRYYVFCSILKFSVKCPDNRVVIYPELKKAKKRCNFNVKYP